MIQFRQRLRSFRKWLKGGDTFNTKNRDEWLEKKLKDLPAGTSVLDAGAGEQRYKKYCSHLKYVSQDLSQYEGKGNGSALQTNEWNTSNVDIVCDIINMPVEAGFFDNIICTEVLEHLKDPHLAIKEFGRILKPEGVLILTAPFCSLTHFAPYHYCTGFNKYWYEYQLQKEGFKIVEMIENGNYYEYLKQELSRIPYMAAQYSKYRLRLCEKMRLYSLLRMLNKLIKKDTGSKEMLCFGYHIVAIKQNLSDC